MQLILKNFGPIKRGKIDLTKKFYLFVGPNNSGKTYVSQLLWCIFNEKTMEQFSEKFNCLLEGLAVQAIHGVQENYSVELTPVLLNSILENFAQFLKTEVLPKKLKIGKNSAVIGEKFSLAFQCDLETIRQQEFEGPVAVIGRILFLRLKMVKLKGSMTATVTVTEKTPGGLGESGSVQPENVDKRLQDISFKLILRLIFNQSCHSQIFNQSCQTFFLPANRTFLSSFYYYILKIDREEQDKRSQQLSEYLLGLQQPTGGEIHLDALALMNMDKRPYNEIVSNLVEQVNALWESEPIPDYAPLVAEMNHILGGTIEVEKAARIGPVVISFQMSKHHQQLPMYLSSSAVNQLAPLYLYFQYWAKKNQNFLIIDEPEENLHPHNQIALCNVLLKFVMTPGNRVLINTHSPLIAENVNNYLSLNLLKERYGLDVQEVLTENELALRTDLAISPEEVGVYFFNGREIMDYEASDYGVYFRDFREVSRQVERASKTLTDYIYIKAHEGEANVFDN